VFSVKYRPAQSYQAPSGRRPFEDWLGSLKDVVAQTRISARIWRAEEGNFGKCESLGGGLFEIKDPLGPGYRVYFGIDFAPDGQEIIVLLLGGTKGSQERDIRKARSYWSDYRRG
jgi:putative addiction module killer protein